MLLVFLSIVSSSLHAKITTTHNDISMENQKGQLLSHSSKDAKIQFDPPFLAFNESPLCITSISSINLVNTNHKDNITILSVSTDSLHFHPSILVQQSVAEPGGKKNATINIIFLPRVAGKVPDAVLVVQTNIGAFVYHMSGEGVINDYRLSPVLNHKLPVDVDYRKPIHIHNPHSETLLIKEIYTSELFLLLGLPEISENSNDATAPSSKATSAAIRKNPNVAGTLWTIPPHSSKTVIFLNFKAKQAGTYQGFVHLKTNFDPLIVHVEFIVSKNGVHRVVDELDFGTIISPSEHRKREVMLLNSSPHPVMVSDVYAASPDAHIQIDFVKGKILPAETVSSAATVVYSGKTEGEFTGSILFKTNDSVQVGSRIEVPYKARVLYGTLDYLADSTAFHVGSEAHLEKEQISELTFMNKFSVPVQFKSAIVEDDATYSIHGFESGRILHPSEKMKMLKVHVHPNDTNLLQKSNLIIETNITKVSVPLYSFHGDLAFEVASKEDDEIASTAASHEIISRTSAGVERASQNNDSVEQRDADKNTKTSNAANINFGVLELDSEKHFEFYLTNKNPVPVDINSWKLVFSDDEGGNCSEGNEVRVNFIKLIPGDTSMIDSVFYDATASRKREPSDSSQHDSSISLQSGDQALMRVSVHSTQVCEQHGHIVFDTTYRKVKVALDLIVMEGSLSFSALDFHFADAFPGRIERMPVLAENSYSRNVTITEIASEDNRFEFVANSRQIRTSSANAERAETFHEIGYVQFNPSVLSKKINYMRDKRQNRKHHEFAAVVTPDEINNYIQRRSLFHSMQRKGETKISSQISFKTDVMKTHRFQVSAELIMPQLSTIGPHFDLGRIQVGTEPLSRMITIKNPSDHPLHVKLLIGNDALKSSILTEYRQDPTRFAKYSQFFIDTSAEGAVPSAIIEAHSQKDLGPIVFTPSSMGDTHAVLYIRNNLTIFDFVEIHAVGSNGRLVVFQDDQLATQELHFHIEQAHLMGARMISPKSSATTNVGDNSGEDAQAERYLKVFSLSNTGNDDLLIHKSFLSGYDSCSAQGVTLHSCGKFKLKPGDKRTYKISFQPDFKSQVQIMEIRFDTNQGSITFPIRFETPSARLPFFSQLSEYGTNRLFSVRGFITLLIVGIGLGVMMYILRELRSVDAKASSRVRSKVVDEMQDVESANNTIQTQDSTDSEDEPLSEPMTTKNPVRSTAKKSSRNSRQVKKIPLSEEKIADTVLDIKEEVVEVQPVQEDEGRIADSLRQREGRRVKTSNVSQSIPPASSHVKHASPAANKSDAVPKVQKHASKSYHTPSPVETPEQSKKSDQSEHQNRKALMKSIGSEPTSDESRTKAGSKASAQKETKEIKSTPFSKKHTDTNTGAEPACTTSVLTTKSRSSSVSSESSVRDRNRSTSTSSTDHAHFKNKASTTASRPSTSVEKQRFRSTGFSDPEKRVYRSKSYESRRAQMQSREHRSRNKPHVVHKSANSSPSQSQQENGRESRSVSPSPNQSPQPIQAPTVAPSNNKSIPEKVKTSNPHNLIQSVKSKSDSMASANAALETNFESLFTPTSMLQASASSLGARSIPSWDVYASSTPRPVDNSPMFSLFHHGSGGSSNSSPNPADVFSQGNDCTGTGGLFVNRPNTLPTTRQISKSSSLFEQSDPYDFFVSEKKNSNKPMELFFKPSGGKKDGAQ